MASYLDGGAVMSAVPGYDEDLLDGSILGLTGSHHTMAPMCGAIT